MFALNVLQSSSVLYSSGVQFVAFCFILWDGSGAQFKGLKEDGRRGGWKAVKAWQSSTFFQLDVFTADERSFLL